MTWTPTSPAVAGADLVAFDRTSLWHPYTSITEPMPTYEVSAARGVRLHLADGRDVVDAMSSWWCAIHGYAVPELDGAVRRQLGAMAHVMFGGLTHAPAVELGRRLVGLSPEGLDRVFLADSGSVSVEVALKMVVQAQRGRGRPQRTRMLALRGGYHGDTTGAMSVCDPVGGMHAMFRDVLTAHVFAPRPPAGFDADITAWTEQVTTLVERHAAELAGVIVEPVLQGAGGMHVYRPACLQVLRDLADEHGLLLVFDEIATGFGRTGTLFAAEHAGVTPDLMCVGKALTGGYLSLAAVLVTDAVAAAISASDSGVLMHGPTFMANPLACAVACASIDLLVNRDWRHQVEQVGAALATGLKPLATAPGVRDVRTLGAVGVVELDHPVNVAAAGETGLQHGVWLRPFRDLVYTMPPYVCSAADLEQICVAISAVVEQEAALAGRPTPRPAAQR